MEEIWKDVLDYEGFYQVSNFGNVKALSRNVKRKNGFYSHLTEHEMKKYKDRHGYIKVFLCRDGKRKALNIHRLVAKAFIVEIKNKNQVNHKDGNKSNNNFTNLEWCNNSENLKHAYKNGLCVTTEKQRQTSRKNVEIAREFIKRKVALIDKNGNTLEEFDSIRDAARKTNSIDSKITCVCNGNRKSTNGLKWKYI